MLAAIVVSVAQWLPVVAILSGVVVPFLVELVTKETASGMTRSALLALLSAVGGVLTIIITNNGVFALIPTLVAMLGTWVSAMAVQAHWTNPATSHAPLLTLRRETPEFGFGPKAKPAAPAYAPPAPAEPPADGPAA